MDYAPMRAAAALTPDEQAREGAYERSDPVRAELEDAIATERDPYKRQTLLALYAQDHGGAPAEGGAAPGARPQPSDLDAFLSARSGGATSSPSGAGGVSLSSFLDRYKPPPAPPEPSGFMRRAVGDTAVSLAKGIIGVPEAVVGLGDIMTGGQAGKVLENEGGAVGFRPKQARAYLDEFYSPEQQEANKAVGDAKGLTETLGAVARNPSVIAQTIAESLPSMLGGGVVARAIMKVAPAVGAVRAGAMGEGIVSAGQTAEQSRQDIPSGTLTGTQALVAAGSGALTGALAVLGGKVAQRLGIHDIDTLLAGKAEPQVTRGFVSSVLGGAVSEGLLEELPQSIQEQVAQNYITGKPLDEGVSQAAVLGALAGAAMGGGSQVAGHRTPGDHVRQEKVVENGPASRAVNAAVETQAKMLDAVAGAVPGEPLAPEAVPQAPGVVPDASTTPGPDVESPAPAAGAVPPLSTSPSSTPAAVNPPPVEIAPGLAPKVDADRALTRIHRGARREENALAFQRRADARTEDAANAVPRETELAATGPAASVQPLAPTTTEGQTHGTQAPTEAGSNAVQGAPEAPAPALNSLARRRAAAGAQAGAAAVDRGAGRSDEAGRPDEGAQAHAAPQQGASGVLSPIDEAARQAASSPHNALPEPTDGQKEAGNYKMGHVRVSGMDVSIETPKGGERKSKAGAPEPWSVTMPAHYGYIRGTEGADGDHVDLFIGDAGDNGRFWVINQHHASDPKAFDEHKVVTGVSSPEEAVKLYKASFAGGFGDKVFTSIGHEIDAATLKGMLPSLSKPKPVPAAPNQPASAAPASAAATSGEGNGQGQEGRGQEEVLTPRPARAPRRPPASVGGSFALGEVSNRLGGIAPSLLADLSEKVQRTQTTKRGKTATYTAWRNPPHAGRGPLFRSGGTADLSEIARVLTEAGFIEQGAENPEQRAQEIIKAELTKPGSTVRVGDAQAIDDEMRRRAELAAGPEDTTDPFDGLSLDDLDEAGYSDASDEVKELTEMLMAAAKANGLDTETLRDDAARMAEGETQQVYHEKLQALTRNAIQQVVGGPAAGQSEPSQARPEDRGGAAGAQGSAAGDRTDGHDSAVRAREPVSGYDAQDLKAKTEREAAAPALERKAQVDREAAGFTLEQQAVEQRKDTTGDMFGGPKPEDVQRAKKPGKAAPVDDKQNTLFEPGAEYNSAFRRWFGDSKVVDKKGKPLVVYHGSPDARFVDESGIFQTFKERYARFGSTPESLAAANAERAFFFSSSRRSAATYADEHRAFDYQNADGAVVPAFLSMQNPLVLDAGGKHWREAQKRGKTSDVVAQAKAAGHDGIIIRNVRDDYAHQEHERYGAADVFVVFSSNQIKHAAKNDGSFDPANPSILKEESPAYNVGGAPATEPFYSELTRQVQAAPMRSAAAQGWTDYIKGLVAKGIVKADEVEWSGINEWLAMQPGKVTNEQVREFLRDNGVQVGETVYSSNPRERSSYEQELNGLVQEYRLWQAENNLGRLNLGSADEHLDDERLTSAQQEWLRDFSQRWDDVSETAENALAGEDPDEPHYSRYTLPGGENYRELLLTLGRMPGKQAVGRKAVFDKYNPQIQALADQQDAAVLGGARDTALIRRLGDEQQALRIQRDAEAAAAAGEAPEFQSGHWAPKNILAHIRFDERTDADGKRVLFIEEIQSDWAQEGKRKGFDSPKPTWRIIDKHGIGVGSGIGDTAEAALADWRRVAGARAGEGVGAEPSPYQTNGGVPSAPFVGKTDAWVALAIKRATKWAVDHGFDRVAFVNGQQSADRYSLEKQVRRIEWANDGDSRIVTIRPTTGNAIEFRVQPDGIVTGMNFRGGAGEFSGKHIADVVGKDIGEKILAERSGDLSGDGLRIGGEGMRSFYDNIVPKVAKDVLRKLGGGNLTQMSVRLGDDSGWGTLAKGEVDYSTQPGFDITPEMRTRAAGGVPLFEERSVYKVNEPTENYDLPFDTFDLGSSASPLPTAPAGGPKERRAAKTAAAAAAAAPKANTLAVRKDPALPGMYHVTSQLVTVGERQVPVERVRTWQDAATALAALSDWAVEHFDVLITDKDGKPLAIVGSFKGAQTQTSVYPGTVLMEALRIEGAAFAWGVHNHPSGNSTLSRADERLSQTMAGVFGPTSVQWRGVAAVAQQDGRRQFSAVDEHGDTDSGPVDRPSGTSVTVPIVNRTLTGGSIGHAISSPSEAKQMVAVFSQNRPGLLFLSAQNHVTAWVPIEPQRDVGSYYDQLINAAAEAGAGAVLVSSPNGALDGKIDAIKAAMAAVDIRTLDAINPVNGESWAERGLMEPEASYKATRTEVNEPMRKALASAVDRAYAAPLPAGYVVGDLFNSAGRLGWWHKTVGTMHNMAERHPAFKRVYDAVQGFLNDVSFYAKEAANLAPRILPSLESWRDILRTPLSAADTKAIAAPIFEGTLAWSRGADGKPVRIERLEAYAKGLDIHDKAQALLRHGKIPPGKLASWRNLPMENYEAAVENRYAFEFLRPGIVWTDAELKAQFNLSDDQVGLYHEFRSSADRSLTHLALSHMVKHAGADINAAMRERVMAMTDVDQAAELLRDHFYKLAAADAARVAVLNATGDKMIEVADRAKRLMAEGYAPLSRFGTYSLDVVDAEGERVYFGLFENARERARMARRMAANYPGAKVTQGTMSQEAFKLFSGVSPETVSLFAEMLGLDATGDKASDVAYQEYLQRALANRSAMKRLIHRKGIAGFSEDAGRVLAGFVYSNSRQVASNLHMQEIDGAAEAVPKEQGELKDAAVQLREYIKNPSEEASGLRGLLFAQYLGGSVAAALVNMTQPLAVTFPYLARWGGMPNAVRQMRGAVADAMKKTTGDAGLDASLKRAEEEGIVSPQEVHQLMAQAMGRATLRSGDGTAAGDAAAKVSNALSKLGLAWGKVFGVAEQANRRITFIAAYRTALERGLGDPYKFAVKAVADTQFVYNKGNKPRWARGPIGSVLMTFKQYSISYLELVSRMWMDGPEGRKAALLMLGVLFLLGGADGLPFADDADDVIDGMLQRMGYNFHSKQAKREFFARIFGEGGAQFILKGVSGLPGSPIDVSGRLGMGNLLPATGLAKPKEDHTSDVAELVGPLGDMAKRLAQGGGQLASGDIAKGLTTIAPKAAQNIVQAADMAQTGQYRDQRGRKVIETTPAEAALKGIGFQPNTVARVQQATGQVQEMVALNKMREADIGEKWAKGIVDAKPELVAEAKADLEEWNRDNPESPIRMNSAAIRRRVQQARMSKEQRLEKTAPREIRGEVRRELEAARP